MTDPLGDWLDTLLPGCQPAQRADGGLPAALGLTEVRAVASGRTALVFFARDPRLGRDVAVKASRSSVEEARDALMAEAVATARLEHPAVLPLYRVTDLEGRLFLELRWGSERTLVDEGERLRLNPPPLTERLAAIRTLASALAHAHSRGLAHGDVHPGNVLVGPEDAIWLCDWGASPDVAGHPGYAAPERLRGGPPTPESDIYALGVIAWELCAARELRTRRHEESVGAWIDRTLTLAVPSIPGLAPGVARWIAAATSSPEDRPTAASICESIDAFIQEVAAAEHADAAARLCLEEARAALVRARELTRRRAEEERVVDVLRAKVPTYAPATDKRQIREAEDRVRALSVERLDTMTDCFDALAAARHLASDPAESLDLVAEAWGERLLAAEAAGDPVAAAHATLRLDGGLPGSAAHRLASRLRAPGRLSLTTNAPGATATIAGFVEAGSDPIPGAATQQRLPLENLPLDPGSWVVTVEAPGKAPLHYPVGLGRLDHHRASVRMWTEAEIGPGWCVMPAGTFRMGGDPAARNPIAACSPFVGDRFVLKTCVLSADYRQFLDDLPPDEADEHCPGEVGLFGSRSRYWARGADGRWSLPEGWDPRWPVMGVALADAAAYARWLSRREGRVVRVPTEEEWEKASRGVDGRLWPWGNRFDATWCHMRESRPGAPRPAAAGDYPVDCSVYGVLDTAGGMREWTTSVYQEGQVVVRGGTWGDEADDCRCASRAGLQPFFRMPWVSFRLVSEAPRSA